MSDQQWFVQVPVTSDAETLAEDAKTDLKSRYPGWEPNDGDLEVIQIEVLSPMAENAAQATARVPPAIFREFGTKLVGREYKTGVAASAVVTINLTDTAGHTIPEGSEIDIDGYAFRTDAAITVPAGTGVVTGVQVTATVPGEEQNALTGLSVTPISALAFISSIVVTTLPSGGVDAEDDTDYQNSLSRSLLLQAKTLVTTRDFELWALEYGDIGRALAINAGDRAVWVTVAKADGTVVSTATKTLLLADYAKYRLVNTVVTLLDPTYTTINVAYTVKVLPGYDATDLNLRIAAMLGTLLSPANWASPKSGDPGITTGWVNETVVRRNLLIDRIGDVEGVSYVYSVDLTSTAGTPVAFTGNTTAASAVVTNVSNMTGVVPGALIGGTNINAGSRVVTVDSATQFTMDTVAAGSGTANPLTSTIVGSLDGRNQQSLLDFGGTVTGGTYTLAISGISTAQGGGPTAAIPYNATGQQVVDALMALGAVEPGDVKYISGGPGPTDIILEWGGKYARRSMVLTIASSLTGTAPTLVHSAVAGQSAINGTGDMTMPGTVSLPLPGTMTGNVI